MTPIDPAAELEVDPKTVARWIDTGRVPHTRHRIKTAKLLDSEQTYLWPELLNGHRAEETSRAELLTMYPHRGAVPADLWKRLIANTTEHLDILAYAALFLVDTHPDLPQRLVSRAAQGLKVRLLLGDPDSAAVAARGEEEGIGENLAARIRLSLRYLEPALDCPGIEVRLHDTPLYNSIYRFDDQMLVNTHRYGTGAPRNPVLHLRRLPEGQVFDEYLASLTNVWEGASLLTGEPTA